uniref:Uncharacterized protein n=1 Tax=Trichuris muris TaxID=70415 RepID=A0A5S6QQ70_TRIMR
MKNLLPVVFLCCYNFILLQASNAGAYVSMPERVQVPEELADWDKPFPSYFPQRWTAQCSFEQCDPEMPNSVIAMRFNKKDGAVDRRMVRRMTTQRPKYNVSQGLPLNPSGRTGLMGRGYLPRFGPSHLVKVILIRKQNKTMAYLKTKNGLSFRDDAFATFVANLSSSKLSSKVIAAIRKNPRFHRRDKLLETILHKAEESATKVAADTMPSPLDTDNAWIELTVYIIPCRKRTMNGRWKRMCKAF